MRNWKRIDDFPTYSVCDEGLVRNDDTGRVLAIQRNAYGIRYVGLVGERKQKNISVARLVAEAFVSRPSEHRGSNPFDTPIHLNGHKDDVGADNLMWRPYWFARKYHRQFEAGITSNKPVIEVKTQARYSCAFVAAMTFGLLEKEIIMMAVNESYVWPTYQEFRFVAE